MTVLKRRSDVDRELRRPGSLITNDYDLDIGPIAQLLTSSIDVEATDHAHGHQKRTIHKPDHGSQRNAICCSSKFKNPSRWRSRHFDWFASNGLRNEIAIPEGFLAGNPAIYAVHFNSLYDLQGLSRIQRNSSTLMARVCNLTLIRCSSCRIRSGWIGIRTGNPKMTNRLARKLSPLT